MKNVVSLMRRFFLAPFILYVFNAMALSADLFVPINVFTFLIVGFLGVPGLLLLIIFLYFIL